MIKNLPQHFQNYYGKMLRNMVLCSISNSYTKFKSMSKEEKSLETLFQTKGNNSCRSIWNMTIVGLNLHYLVSLSFRVTYPWSAVTAPITPRMRGHPCISLSPLLCRIWRTHSSCRCRMSGWDITHNSCSGASIKDCSFWNRISGWI